MTIIAWDTLHILTNRDISMNRNRIEFSWFWFIFCLLNLFSSIHFFICHKTEKAKQSNDNYWTNIHETFSPLISIAELTRKNQRPSKQINQENVFDCIKRKKLNVFDCCMFVLVLNAKFRLTCSTWMLILRIRLIEQ